MSRNSRRSRYDEIPVIVVDLVVDADAPFRAFEPLVGANDADIFHMQADFVPVVGHDHGLVVSVSPPSQGGMGRASISTSGRRRRCVPPRGGRTMASERVARQAVGAVQAGAGDFPAGEQALDAGFPEGVDDHAPAEIMRCGHDRDRIPGDVDVELQAGFVDVGKPRLQKIAIAVGDVEKDELVPGFLQFRVDRLGDDVPRARLFSGWYRS